VFGLGIWEILVILVLALLVLGPKRLPEAARSLGRGLSEFRRASNEIRGALTMENPPDPPPGAAAASKPEGTTAQGAEKKPEDGASKSSEAEPAKSGADGSAPTASAASAVGHDALAEVDPAPLPSAQAVSTGGASSQGVSGEGPSAPKTGESDADRR